MGEALRIAALAKRYNRYQALAGVELEIAAVEALGLVGSPIHFVLRARKGMKRDQEQRRT